MRRKTGHAGLATGIAALSVLAAAISSCSSHDDGGSAAPTTGTGLPAAVPCTSDAAAANSPGTTTIPPPANATWSGVTERIDAKFNADGSSAGTPSQFTRVSVSGTGPATVQVPMSDTDLHRRDKGDKPPFANGQAEITLDPQGTAVQELDSGFPDTLPASIAVSYSVDGQPVPASEVGGKGGTVEARYTVTNTSTAPVTVCFMGFDGKLQQQTVPTPQPLLAHLHFTMPSNATSFDAPGSSLSPDSDGVDVGWTVLLFEPFGPTTQSFSYTMSTSSASIPKATLDLDDLDPTATGAQAVAASTAALGTTQADASAALDAVDSDLAKLQQQAGQGRSPDSRDTSGDARGKGGDPTDTSGDRADRSGGDRSSDSTTSGTPDSQDQEQTIVVSSSDVDAVRAEADKVKASIDSLTTQAPAVDKAASDLSGLAQTVNQLTVDVKSKVDAVVSELPPAVQNAITLKQTVDQLEQDLAAFPPDQQSTAPYQKLATDLNVAKTLAQPVSDALDHVQQAVLAVQAEVDTLRGDVSNLEQQAQALASSSAEMAKNTVDADFTNAVDDLEARFGSAQQKAADAAAQAQQKVGAAVAGAEQGAEVSIDAAKAKSDQAAADAQKTLASANADYAHLLCLEQQGAAHRLPGGNATGAVTQSGLYRYEIAGS